jgi:hypothetical protein
MPACTVHARVSLSSILECLPALLSVERKSDVFFFLQPVDGRHLVQTIEKAVSGLVKEKIDCELEVKLAADLENENLFIWAFESLDKIFDEFITLTVVDTSKNPREFGGCNVVSFFTQKIDVEKTRFFVRKKYSYAPTVGLSLREPTSRKEALVIVKKLIEKQGVDYELVREEKGTAIRQKGGEYTGFIFNKGEGEGVIAHISFWYVKKPASLLLELASLAGFKQKVFEVNFKLGPEGALEAIRMLNNFDPLAVDFHLEKFYFRRVGPENTAAIDAEMQGDDVIIRVSKKYLAANPSVRDKFLKKLRSACPGFNWEIEESDN